MNIHKLNRRINSQILVELSLEILDQLTMDDKKILYLSLPNLNKNLDFFVIRFYYYFLQTKAGVLFKHTDIKRQYRMFHRSLNTLVTHLAEPKQVQEHLNALIMTHQKYGVLPDYVDDFIDSFMKALKEIYTDESDNEILNIWYKVVRELMIYFKKKLEN